MKLTEAASVHTAWETRSGFDRLFDMIIEKDDYKAMRSINEIVGKAIDDVAKKHGYPFSFDKYYRHLPYFREDEDNEQ